MNKLVLVRASCAWLEHVRDARAVWFQVFETWEDRPGRRVYRSFRVGQ